MSAKSLSATHIIGAVIAGYASTCITFFFLLDFYWFGSAPYQPDHVFGFIYPHNEHGTVKYLSAFQVTSWSLLFGTFFPAFIIAGALMPRPDMKKWPRWCTESLTNPDEDPKGRLKWWMLASAAVTSILLVVLGAPLVRALNEAGLVLNLYSG